MYDKVVKEARRKIDVNRILVEDVRSAITEEKGEGLNSSKLYKNQEIIFNAGDGI